MYNPTCLITGKKDNLRMYSIRNKEENMIGWVFIHESIKFEDVMARIDWHYKAELKVETDSPPDTENK